MKINRLLLAGVLALASITGASAQTTIHIIGSTAYRAAVNDAIRSILATGYTWGTTAGSTTSSPSNSTLGGASTSMWVGTIKAGLAGAGQSVTIKTAFSGSVAGVADLAQGVQAKFLADSNASLLTTTGVGGLTTTDLETPDFAWTDADYTTDQNVCKNASSQNAYKAINTAGLVEAGGAGAAEGQGIVFFDLVEEALVSGSTSPFTNLTTDNLAQLVQNGYISLAQLSGTDNATNETTEIVLTGRSEDSGSRANTFAAAFEGATSSIGSTSQRQYQPSYSGNYQTYSDNGSLVSSAATATVEEGGTGSTLTSLALWPNGWGLTSDTTIRWTSAAGLGGGFNGGSNVALAMSATNPITGVTFTDKKGHAATAVYVVSYLAGADASTCLSEFTSTTPQYNTTNAQATRLTYNGIKYTQANVLDGAYNIWGYEHAYYLPTASGVLQNAMDDIANEVETVTAEDDNLLNTNVSTDAAVGIFIPGYVGGTEEVTRTAPGVPVSYDY